MLNSKKIFLFDLEQNSGRNTRKKNRVFMFLGFFVIFLDFLEILISDPESASSFELEDFRSDFRSLSCIVE